MIRVIVRETDSGEAVHVGGPVHVAYKTFDLYLPELEAHLLEHRDLPNSYATREVVGVELLEPGARRER